MIAEAVANPSQNNIINNNQHKWGGAKRVRWGKRSIIGQRFNVRPNLKDL